MNNRIHLPNIFQELVAQSFPLRSTFDNSGNIGEFKSRMNDFFSGNQFIDACQSFIRHFNHPNIRVNGGKRIICHLRTRLSNCIKSVDLPTLGSPTIPAVKAIWLFHTFYLVCLFCLTQHFFESLLKITARHHHDMSATGATYFDICP